MRHRLLRAIKTVIDLLGVELLDPVLHERQREQQIRLLLIPLILRLGRILLQVHSQLLVHQLDCGEYLLMENADGVEHHFHVALA